MMLRLTQVIDAAASAAALDEAPRGAPAQSVLTMRFEDRRRSRLRARLDDGREAALLLPRGTVLRDGDRLRDPEANEVVTVRAAAQTLSLARTADGLLLARAAYHLGNRHVPVQVGPGWLAYEHDHVLDHMVEELGLNVDTHVAPFEPEAGGYRHAANEAGAHHHGGHHHDH
jgi:urease accessory protein